MGAIDDLVDANRLNVQLLTSVPAVLLLAAGSRLSFKLAHVLITRGLRSMREVHDEMSSVLNRVERCLLLAGSPRPQSARFVTSRAGEDSATPTTGGRRPSSPPSGRGVEVQGEAELSRAGVRVVGEARVLQGAELGELVLHLHSYLLLLDYSSAVYPPKACDSIHHELQDLLRQGQLSVTQQAALLRAIKERGHAALAKSL